MLIFLPQPGCNYSIDVTSDEESAIDHSLPRSRLVEVGSVCHYLTYAHVYHCIFWKHEYFLLVNTTGTSKVQFFVREVFKV